MPLLADSFQELYDLAQASEIQQMCGIRPERRCRCVSVVGQVHGDGGVGAIGQLHDQVRIRPLANPHDRHLLRSTTDDLYLVHDGQVEPFEGDLDDYQQWLIDLQRQESQQDAPEKESGANSAQARKDQKRREAEFRTQTQPLRKQIAKLEQQMEKLGAELAAVEEQLADSALYDISRKAELTDCLQKQSQAKSALEETEMTWLDAQEQLEQLTQAFDA